MIPYNYDRCEHCTADVTRCRPWNMPDVSDCEAWAKLAAKHDDGCVFVATRNFRAHFVDEQDEEGWGRWLVADNDADNIICRIHRK